MSAPVKLYGIANCGTVKKARAALDARGVVYQFHDFKKQGVTHDMLAGWITQVGWKRLLKKTGPTWAGLSDAVKGGVVDDATALPVLLEHPNVIKRPVLEKYGKVLATGFDAAEYQNLKP
jgi:Spx/MgsR family transcriptional regulator